MILSDGCVDSDEVALLDKLANFYGLSSDELAQIKKNHRTIPFIAPESRKLRFRLLFDLTVMMMADKEIRDVELKTAALYAEKLVFSVEVPEELALFINAKRKDGNNLEQIFTLAEHRFL